MAEYIVPVPTQCNPQRFLLHRDMLIHAVMCWNRALNYVQNVLGGTLAEGVRYITFEDFIPSSRCPFYPLTTRDMRINPGLHWKPDARVDRSLWQRITDYIRAIVTTNGVFLRDRIGTGGGYTWERGGPVKTNPDDPETWQYQSGDQDLLRGMQSGRYRPADWIYLSIVGEYHRLVGGDVSEPEVTTAEIIEVTGLYSKHWYDFTLTDKVNVVTYEEILPPATISRQRIRVRPLSVPSWTKRPPESKTRSINISNEYFYTQICGIEPLEGGAYVIDEYNWPEDIPYIDTQWDMIVRYASYLHTDLFIWDDVSGYISEPNAFQFKIAKRTNRDVKARLSYTLAQYATFDETPIRVIYNASSTLIVPRHDRQYFDLILSGAKGSEHIVSVEFLSSVNVVKDFEFDSDHDIYRTTEVKRWNPYQGRYITIGEWNEWIGHYRAYEFLAKVFNVVPVKLSWIFEYA
jgi:hypothetical protein